jgi:two-component system osmolarity sensor histidine kinase EnvZ
VEIRQVNQSFNRMVADLAKLDEDRALLLAGISHDLRTPLTRLRLELEISQDLAPDVRAAMAGDIDQIDAIVRQFLDYARGDPQQPSQPVDVIALLRDTIARQRLPQARIETRLDGVEAVVDGHPMELRRAVDNLIANAARYGRDGHGRLTLTVALHVESNQAVVEIADGGPGIAAAEIERLRRPFQRGDSARGGSDGAGLGLAIVDRIAAQHGGRLVLAANLPTGLRACLYLPLQARGASSS